MPITHEQIDQFEFVDRYLMGKLATEEGASFEEHFVDCSQCIARLQVTKNFIEDLRLVESEINHVEPVSAASTAWWQGLRGAFSKALIWATIGLVITAIIGAIFTLNYTRRLRAEAEQAKNLSQEWQRRYEEEHQAAMTAEQKRQEAETQQAEQVRDLEARLKEQQTRPGRSLPAESNLVISELSSVRGQAEGATGIDNQINVPHSAKRFAIIISLEEELPYRQYSLTIFDQRQQVIWKSGRQSPAKDNSFSLLLATSAFPQGRYTVIVEGLNPDGGRTAVGRYPFKIIRTP